MWNSIKTVADFIIAYWCTMDSGGEQGRKPLVICLEHFNESLHSLTLLYYAFISNEFRQHIL